MIRITKQTDYGIVLLTHLAAHPDRQYAAPELATEARLPLPMVSKILKLLARDGLLASGRLDDALIDGFLARCADPAWWTQTIAFTAVHARSSAG